MNARGNFDFKNENKVRKIGGKLSSDYYSFKREIEYINENFFGLFCILHLTDDINLIIETLNDRLYNICSIFINKVLADIEAGKIPINKFISEKLTEKLESLSPEDSKKVWERETKRRLKAIYSETEKRYLRENGLFSLKTRHSKKNMEIFRNSLFVTPSRIEIDGAKFIKIYLSYMEAYESETKKIHEQAAEAINEFFNGIEITQYELSKYFILEFGRVKVHPASVNIQDYSRLGKRISTPVKKDEP